MADEKRSLGQMAWSVIKAVGREIRDVVYDKMGPQGAAELAKALNHEASGYVAYGPSQAPMPIDGPQQSYQEMLNEAAQHAGPEQEQEQGIEH